MNTNRRDTETFIITGDWAKRSRELKKTFMQLTDADLHLELGKEHDLLSRLQSRLGKRRGDIIELLKGGELRTVLTVDRHSKV